MRIKSEGNHVKGVVHFLKMNPFVQFLIANVVYSISTFALNLFFPFIFEKSFFEEFVYIFQMILFMNSMTGLGIATGLLRNHSIDKYGTYAYSIFTILLVQLFLFILGFFPKNPISTAINIEELAPLDHIIFYLSVIVTNIFLFNRAFMNAEKSFILMLKSIISITIMRFVGLFLIFYYGINSNVQVMILLFILPFLYEFVFLIRNMFRSFKIRQLHNLKKYYEFIAFCLKTFFSGGLFIVTNRIFLIHLKDTNLNFASLLAFSSGFVGIVGLFNYSFTNYFIGKLTPGDINEILGFKRKVRDYAMTYFSMITLVVLISCSFVYFAYSNLDDLVVLVLGILIVKTAVISYFGFTNILTKTLDLLRYEILINSSRFVLVYLFVKTYSDSNFIFVLISVSLIMIIGEYVLFKIIDFKLSRYVAVD